MSRSIKVVRLLKPTSRKVPDDFDLFNKVFKVPVRKLYVPNTETRQDINVAIWREKIGEAWDETP